MTSPTPPIPMTVMLVDNEAVVRWELADRLGKMGFVVLQAGTADDAIALLKAHPEITLLFTDIKMPGTMDGVRLAHYVRDRWPPVKIIVLSGAVDVEPSALPHGSIFLPKPYDPELLVETLGGIMGGGGPRIAGPRSGLRA